MKCMETLTPLKPGTWWFWSYDPGSHVWFFLSFLFLMMLCLAEGQNHEWEIKKHCMVLDYKT